MINQLLANSVKVMSELKNINLNWIGKIIRAIVEKPYGVGIGIIFFTLILKLITLPFDILSRVSSKKNSLKMEQLRPELERLQKQYSNNKQLYQQKVMALQKQAGYSPLTSCLPSILSIVIFFVVINAFSTYSNYATNQIVRKMSDGFNAKIEYLTTQEGGNLLIKENETLFINRDSDTYKVWLNTSKTINGELSTPLLQAKDSTNTIYLIDQNNPDSVNRLYGLQKIYISGGFYSDDFELDQNGNAIAFKGTEQEKTSLNEEISTDVLNAIEKSEYLEDYIYSKGQQEAKRIFKNQKNGFLWIKNVWVQDVSYKSPLVKFDKAIYGKNFKEDFKILTADMKTEKSQPNGYFILVVLSIGSMLLSQIIMSKDQKAQIELGNVDGAQGTAGQTQKVMKVMLPVMFGIFAFIYTSAFSIYMIVSSLFGTLSTVVISAIVKKIFDKKQAEIENQRLNKRYYNRKNSMNTNKKNNKK